ncbi:MAG: TonB-dependent receptor [Steroidobacteraceae bacterium]
MSVIDSRHISSAFTSVFFLAASSGLAAGLPDAPADDPALDEIVVVSEKVAEPLRLVPLSVLVVSEAMLADAGIQDFDDLPQLVPSLTISKTSQPANNSINIRGIGTYAFSIGVESSVAVVVDDMPLAFQPGAFTALADVSQVEVLRGPQSTLFGKASNAGVIRITTAPVSPVFEGRLQAALTDDHERRLQGSLSGPIGTELGYRLSANFSDFRGTLQNLTTGHWLNGQSDLNLRGKLEWHPAERWSLSLLPFWTRTNGTCCTAAETFIPSGSITGTAATGAARIPAASFLAGVVPGPHNRTIRMDVDARGDALHRGSGLRMEYQTDGLTFLALSSYEDYALHDIQDTDSTDIDFSMFQSISPRGGSANGGYFDVSSVTQELRVASASERRMQWVAGTFWSRTRSRRQFVRGSNDLDDYNLTTVAGQVVRPVVPANLPTTNDTSYTSYNAKAGAGNLAVFAQGTWAAFEGLDMLAGIRRGREKIRYSFLDQVHGVAYGVPGCSPQTASGIAIQTCDADGSTSGRVGLRARPSARLMLFATYSRGHKGKAYDLSSTLTLRSPAPAAGQYPGLPLADVVAAKQPVAAEHVESYEAGFKHTIVDDRWFLNVTAYRMVVHNLQAQSRDLLINQNVLNSLGQVTSRGVEAESSAVAGRFSFNASAAYGRAVIDEFPHASCYRGQTVAEGCVSGTQVLAGKSLPNAPTWSANVLGQYVTALADRLDAVASVGYRWQSSVNNSLLRDPAARQPGFGVLNVTAGLRARAWQASLFLNNVLNQEFRLNGGRDTHINNPAGGFATNWRPARDGQRSAGVRLSYGF